VKFFCELKKEDIGYFYFNLVKKWLFIITLSKKLLDASSSIWYYDFSSVFYSSSLGYSLVSMI